MLLGYERTGRNKNKYNICCGTMEPSDKQCYLNLAKRELREEFKINFNACEKYKTIDGYLIPIFVVYFKDINIDVINKKLIDDMENYNLPNYMKEIDHVKFFNIYTTNKSVTGFTKKTIKKYL